MFSQATDNLAFIKQVESGGLGLKIIIVPRLARVNRIPLFSKSITKLSVVFYYNRC